MAVEEFDPQSVLDWTFTVSQGTGDDDILLPGESVASFTLTPDDDALAAGLRVTPPGYPAPSRSGLVLKAWLYIAPERRGDDWSSKTLLGLNVHIISNNSPPRETDVTCLIPVKTQVRRG